MTYKRRTEWSWRSGGAALPVVAGLVLAGSARGQCVPSILSSVDTPHLAIGVAVSGTVAYVADSGSGLQVIDVSDPGSPVILGSVNTPDFARGVAVSGAVAYVADGERGLRVIDVSSCEPCPADLDGNGAVDFGDILAILSAWGNKGGPEDLDGNGAVDFEDILRILDAWGNKGGPEDLDGSGTVDFGDILAVLAVWGPCS